MDERYLRATVLALVEGLESGSGTSGTLFSKKNAVLFLSLLFHWNVLPVSIPFNLFRRFVLLERDLDLVLHVFRYCGKKLRSNHLLDFKEIFKFVMQHAEDQESGGTERMDKSKLDFLIAEFNDLKTAKKGFAVMDRFVQTETWLRSCVLLRRRRRCPLDEGKPLLLEDVHAGVVLGGGDGDGETVKNVDEGLQADY